MNEPLISVIIPVHNVQKYIRKCIDSVTSQTYRNIEILIVDDGSSDGSSEICDEYADKDKRIIVLHTENLGVSAARNYAMEKAQGRYFSFIDSDDWIEPDTFEVLVSYLESYDPDIISFKYYIEWLDKTEDVFSEIEGNNEVLLYESPDIIKTFILTDLISQVCWNKLFKRELFADVRFPEGETYEDLGCMYRIMLKAHNLLCIPEYLYHYRKRRSSIANDHTMKNISSYWYVNKRRYDQLYEEYPCLKDKLSENCLIAASRFWNCIYSCPKKEREGAKGLMNEIKIFINSHQQDIDRLAGYSGMIKLLRTFKWNMNPLFLKALTIIYTKRNHDDRNRMFD